MLKRSIEQDTRILSVRYQKIGDISVLFEKWSADGLRGRSAVFLSEQVSEMDDAALRTFLLDQGGVEVSGATMVKRMDSHTFLNYAFEAL